MKTGSLALLLPMVFAAATCLAAEPRLTVNLGGGQQMELVLIQAGSFTQGSPPDEPQRGPDETAHRSTITKPFYIGVTPVTVGQFKSFIAATGHRTEAEQGNSGGYGVENGQLVQKPTFTWKTPGFPQTDAHPVTLVTWPDAQLFCRWASRMAKRAVTLPTEAQWEYACRAGTATAYPNGADAAAAGLWAWHKGNSGGATHPVGEKEANAWGLHDMGGQVWEWCEDWFAPYPPGDVTDFVQGNATLSDKPRRVLRGGSFLKDAGFARSATRYRNDPRSRNADNGFRVVVSAAEPTEANPPVEAPVNRRRTVLPDPVPAVTPPAPAVPPAQAPAPVSAPLPPQRSGGVPIFGVACLGAVLVGIVGLVFLLVRRARKPGAGPSGPAYPGGAPTTTSAGSVKTALVDDGFWIQASVPAGTAIAWQCDAGGQVYEGTVTYQPGPKGQFVFIGKRPSGASARVSATTARATLTPNPPPLHGTDRTAFTRGFQAGSIQHRIESDDALPPTAPSPPQDSSRGYPSAY